MSGSLLTRLTNDLVVSRGWRRRLLAFGFGALLALSMAPFFLVPVLFVSLPALVFLLDGAVATRPDDRETNFWPAFGVGWWFGFGYFLMGLWWIGAAFLVDAETFAWLLPFAVIAMPAGLALFWALGIALARQLWSTGAGRILALTAGLGVAEWMRGHLLTGFPWNLLGMSLAPHPLGMQSAALIGIDGLTVVAVLLGASTVLLVPVANRRASDWTARTVGLIAMALAVGHLGYGAVRLMTATVKPHPNVHVRIVQPSIPQAEKWLPENRGDIFNALLELSDRAVTPDRPELPNVTHLIWPETAFPFLLTDESSALAALAALLPDQTTLLAGAVRRDPTASPDDPDYYNSVYVIDSQGLIAAAYDKVHLVPFGEYLPFQDLLEAVGLQQLTQLKGGFAKGPGYRTLATLPGTPPMLPLICYEVLFFGNARSAASQASWILNVTNDAWFGDTPGPRQHLHAARIRAVSEGLAVVRAANTGISAIIDPYGRILDRLDLNVIGVIDGDLPLPLPASPPVHWLWGIAWLVLAGFSALGALVMRRQPGTRQWD